MMEHATLLRDAELEALDPGSSTRLALAMDELAHLAGTRSDHCVAEVQAVGAQARQWLGVLGALGLAAEYSCSGRVDLDAGGLALEARARGALDAWQRTCLAGDPAGEEASQFASAGLELVQHVQRRLLACPVRS